MTKEEHTHISSRHRFFSLDLKELLSYRDLIVSYARRTLAVSYKQTIAGPVWLVLGPLITSVVYMIVFGNIAHLAPEGVPQILFYLYGNAMWSLCAGVVTQNSDTFTVNADVFGKVYFPRLAIPLSHILVAWLQFLIQFVLAGLIALYEQYRYGFDLTWGRWPLIILLILQITALALGMALIFSSLTVRYKDLRQLIGHGVRLWMFLTPVVYPLTQVTGRWMHLLVLLNPMTAPLECMRWCLWGMGAIPAWNIFYSVLISLLVFAVGFVLFKRAERDFVDII